jgi:hypothetical protein
MFYWTPYMLDQNKVDSRLACLSEKQIVLFAASCAQHAILPFETLRKQGAYVGLSRSDSLLILLAALEKVWSAATGPTDVTAEKIERDLDAFSGPDLAEEVGYNEGELINAVEQTIACLKENGSVRRAILTAKSSYEAVSKVSIGKSLRGRASTKAAILDVEMQSADCLSELAFQLKCLSTLESGATPSIN